jgi:hypothetical protein
MNKSTVENKAVWTAVFLILLYVSPLFILGENAHIRVHDNLDSNLAWYKILIRSGEWFGPTNAVIPQIINGLPRNALGTEFSGIVLLHALFPTMLAYAISQTIIRVIAFWGMYLLLKQHFVTDPNSAFIRVGVALAFSLTPVWPSGMLSTLGQPLALWAFLNIRSKQGTWKEWLTLACLPFYSSLILGFFFLLSAIFLIWLWDLLRLKKWNFPYIGSIIFMGAVYLLVEYRLLSSLVLADQPTSRNEFVSSRLDNWQTVRLAANNFIFGHNHVMTLHTLIILPFLCFILYLCMRNRKWRNDPTAQLFIVLFGINLALSVWYAGWFHKAWQPLKEQFKLLNTFNFARFHFLRPMVIYLEFALGCLLLWRWDGRKARRLIYGIILGQIALLCVSNEEIVYSLNKQPSFKQFYAVDQFREIGEYIGKPKENYRVASIGLHPAIAQYNGFYTLDTYNNYYPLTYKHSFRKIIAAELNKNKQLKKYYDTWGGRCYLFVDELGKKYDYRKTSHKKPSNGWEGPIFSLRCLSEMQAPIIWCCDKSSIMKNQPGGFICMRSVEESVICCTG